MSNDSATDDTLSTSRRPVKPHYRAIAAVTGIALAVTGVAGVGVSQARATVMLEVDGVTRPVQIWRGTVADVLEAADVSLSEHDLVSPDVDEHVSSGQNVVVRTAHPVSIDVDGSLQDVWTTSNSIDTILADASSWGSDVAIPADRSSSRAPLTSLVSRPQAVGVSIEDKATEVVVRPGDDVRTALKQADLDIGANDSVKVASTDQGMKVTVTKVERSIVDSEIEKAFETEDEETAELFEGEQVVKTKGINGTANLREWVETNDGNVVHSALLNEEVTKEPTTQIVQKGTAKATPEALAAKGIDSNAKLQEFPEPDGTTSIRYPRKDNSAPTKASTEAGSPATAGTVYSGEDPKGIAQKMVVERGWAESEFQCLVTLWQRESGWNPYANNASSGAYGIPQSLPGSKMASAGADWQTNPATQITWGLGYIAGRYGTPCAALAHSNATNWY